MSDEKALLDDCRYRLKTQLSYAKIFNELARVSLKSSNEMLVLSRMAQLIGEGLQVERCLIYRVDFTSSKVLGLSEWRNEAVDHVVRSSIATYPLALFEGGLTWLQTRKEPLVSHKSHRHYAISADASGSLLHDEMGIASLLWMPFLFDDVEQSTQDFYLLAINQLSSECYWESEAVDFVSDCVRLINLAIDKLRVQSNLQTSDLRWRFALEGAGDGVWDWDISRNQLYFSPQWCQMMGDSAHSMPTNFEALSARIHPENASEATLMLDAHLQGALSDYRAEFRLQKHDGNYVWVLARGKVMSRDHHGNPLRMVGTHSDISDKKQQEERAYYLAFYDTLTGLPNRALFQDRAQQALALAKREKTQMALLFLDLDGFKQVNDSLGHQAGDALLQLAGDRLRKVLRDTDTIARLGGDEFVMVVNDATQWVVEQVCLRVLTALSEPYEIDEASVNNVSASLGVSVFPSDGDDYATLLKHADAAMYAAKAGGKNRVAFFDHAMSDILAERLALDAAVRQAQSKEELYLVYQPQYSLNTGRIIGAEVLIRWQHPVLGLVPPAKFIPVAEENGLIIEIGRWVLSEAIKKIAYLIALGNPLTLAVNVSARQFTDAGFAEFVKGLLGEYDVPGELLELELTESLLMNNIEQGLRVMRDLTDVGVQWAVDDFGTGYSSLAYLRRFPLSKLKIDRSFVLDMDQGGQSVVRTIIRMAQSLHMSVIAEGVEDDNQLNALMRMACDEVQGYLLSRPVSGKDLLGLLQDPLSACSDVLRHRVVP
jgi:diguanylate cyclase (GGDEF)-like protein/PAS domain S-box-containing protein